MNPATGGYHVGGSPVLALDKIGDRVHDSLFPRSLDFLPLDAIRRSILDDLVDLSSRGTGRSQAESETPA